VEIVNLIVKIKVVVVVVAIIICCCVGGTNIETGQAYTREALGPEIGHKLTYVLAFFVILRCPFT
jgi:hypothetical protein